MKIIILMLLSFSVSAKGPDYYSQYLTPNVSDYLLKIDKRMDVCPKYPTLSTIAKKQSFSDLFKAIGKYESAQNTILIYIEPSLGKDMATKEVLLSEGLLQVSYQDAILYKCAFDAKKDLAKIREDLKNRDSGDFNSRFPERDTLSPEKNLKCGLLITEKLLNKYPDQNLTSVMSKYWSTMRGTREVSKLVLKYFKSINKDCF